MREGITYDDAFIIPQYSEIESRNDVDTTTRFTRNFNISVPLVGAPMDSICGVQMIEALMGRGAVGCLHRFSTIDKQIEAITWIKFIVEGRQRTESDFHPPIVASIGATGDYLERAERSLEAGANVLLIDVAHGDHIHVKRALARLNSLSNRASFDVIAGNISTGLAARRLEDWGADAIRVGQGNGSACVTRLRTGIGVPQLTAIFDVVKVTTIPVIADGGIKTPGDVAKALAAGADSVMVGSLFSGTLETPGEIFTTGVFPNEQHYKTYRGSASASAKGIEKYVEGTATLVPLKGSVIQIINTIMDGVRSSMSYVGASDITSFRHNAQFMRVTNAGLIEATPHGLRNI